VLNWVDFFAAILMKKKVVFFFPAFSSLEATAPLGILAVASPLVKAGYQVKIIDSTITSNLQQQVMEEMHDALCLCISLVTGPMIRETATVGRAIKKFYPEKPVILGGWHPSLLPDQTLQAEFVDIVVRGQGENSLLEVIERLSDREALKEVRGIGFKQSDELVFTPERPLLPLRDLPFKAYQLGNYDAYEKLCGKRWAMYISSLACPYNCAYCTNEGVYGRSWNALPAEQVVSEMTDLVRRYRFELLWVVDDNFLVDHQRAVAIAHGLVRSEVKFSWSIQASTNLVTRLSDAELSLLRQSGLRQICQGADSASPKVLKLMNKSFQKIDTMVQAAEKCVRAGIRPSFNIIFGFPGEGEAERQETIRFISFVCKQFPSAEFWTNIFTPYPGAPIMRQANELGIEIPSTFEGWADFFPRHTILPWLKGRNHQRVQTMREYLRIAYERIPIAADRRTSLAKALSRAISLPARFRLDHGIYGFPLEIWIKKALGRLPMFTKSKVDALAPSPTKTGLKRTVLRAKMDCTGS
jgi:anaerobic magnesium-protoporphyrin IX monomethyl ester cyclase